MSGLVSVIFFAKISNINLSISDNGFLIPLAMVQIRATEAKWIQHTESVQIVNR